jgi:hypothetical protein
VNQEAVFFVVEKAPIPGGERASLYHEFLPPRLTGKNSNRDGLIYLVRVDTLPHAAKWLSMSVTELYEEYKIARDKNSLPQSYKPEAKSESAPAIVKLGHRERLSNRPWGDLPAEPWPTVEELDARANRRLP